ncbi:type 2 isopentenyl-diphosphate Delta-isomerase [Candidatus Micrarchaeota archaeon]|nr:type 2 isopentenyl-diphosphate Delta-isomerase [Candidatus Micrarchaeota archaeon]
MVGRRGRRSLIEKRKYAHIKLVRTKNVEFDVKRTGFEDIDFIHNALPELNLEDVDMHTEMFGKRMEAPIIIEAITGGFDRAKDINKRLAKAAQEHGIAMGLGSMRAMIEKPDLGYTFKVRDVAPDIPLIGNIGIAQAITMESERVDDALKEVDADALAIHLNPAQEVIQPEGDREFRGGEEAIERLAKELSVPVIVKEVGSGLSDDVAKRVKRLGVKMLDTGGAGGTSWTKIEYYRNRASVPGFEEWGIPTVLSVLMCSRYLPTIASGGVRSGIDVAKAIALGARYAGAALPFVRAKDPGKLVEIWKSQLRTVMLLTGSATLKQLDKSKIMVYGRTAELLRYAIM